MNFWRQDPKTGTIHIGRNERSTLCGRRLDSTLKKIVFRTARAFGRHFCTQCALLYADPLTALPVEDTDADITRT